MKSNELKAFISDIKYDQDDIEVKFQKKKQKINFHPVVSIIILNYNKKKISIKCLRSLSKLNYFEDSLNFVLVENSTCSEEKLSKSDIKRSGIRNKIAVLQNSRNVGFAKGVNIGAEYAFNNFKSDFVLLINNDLIIPETSRDIIQELLAVYNIMPKVASIGPKIYYEKHKKGRKVIWTAGASFREKPPEVDRNDEGIKGIKKCDFVIGACMMISRKVWDDVGMFNPDYFAYYEEVEWCYRAKKKGYNNFCLNDISVCHGSEKIEGIKRDESKEINAISTRNQIWLASRYPYFIDVVVKRLFGKFKQFIENGNTTMAEAIIIGLLFAKYNICGCLNNRKEISKNEYSQEVKKTNRNDQIVFYMGRITPWKNPHLVVSLTLKLKNTEAHLWGEVDVDPENQSQMKYLYDLYKSVKKNKGFVNNKVFFYGAYNRKEQKEFLNEYSKMKALMILPSRNEGFGIVYLESMKHSIPFIGAESGGIKSLVKKTDKAPGLLIDFEKMKEETIRKEIEKIFEYEVLYSRLKNNCKSFWKNISTVGDMFENYEEIFKQVGGRADVRVVILTGPALYKIGGVGEWLLNMTEYTSNNEGLKYMIVGLPGRYDNVHIRYRDVVKRNQFKEYNVYKKYLRNEVLDNKRKFICFFNVLDLFIYSISCNDRLYIETLLNFYNHISISEYYTIYSNYKDELISYYEKRRNDLTRKDIEFVIEKIFGQYLLQNLLFKQKFYDYNNIFLSENFAIGILGSILKSLNSSSKHILSLHSFHDKHLRNEVYTSGDLSCNGKDHIWSLLRNLFCFVLINSDGIVCISEDIESHIKKSYRDIDLPEISTIYYGFK